MEDEILMEQRPAEHWADVLTKQDLHAFEDRVLRDMKRHFTKSFRTVAIINSASIAAVAALAFGAAQLM